MIYLQLFYTFFKIGLFGFGGGYGMLSLIRFEIVEHHHWLTGNEFTNIIAISQATPGAIGINSATYVGYTTAGVFGSIVADVAVVLPSFFLMYVLINIFNKYKENLYVKSILNIMQYVIIGLIASAVAVMITQETFGKNFSDFAAWSILAVSFVAMKFFKVSPILLIVLGGIFGWFFL